MKSTIILLSAVGLLLAAPDASGQILGRIRQSVENRAADAITDKILGKQAPSQTAGGPGSTGRTRGQNTSGEGLVSTPPNVQEQLKDAESAYKAGSYGQARQAVQQAMLGVEMEIGQKILASLPESISGLTKDPSVDQVTSSGWGWVGLTIHRQYQNQADKELRVTVANNAAWMSALNLYLANGGHAQTTGGQQNWKQTKVKGHQAVIEYDEGSGYKLSVPLGQHSLVMYEGVNFKNEKEMVAAAETLDLAGIKKMLGEQ